MYKVQVVLVPPSVRDNFVPVGFTSTLEDSSQLMTNGATQANLPNGLENSIQNWNSTNNSMMLSSYFTQPRLKRFLMFTNPSNTLLDLADEILTKCEKMYPNVANDIEILSLQDSNSCDLDPDFVVKDVFNMDNTVRVILKDEINLDADVTQPVSLYGNAKRRKLNNGEQQQAPIIQQQVSTNQQQTQNTGTLKVAKKRNSNTTARSTTNPNLRISTPLANQIFPSQASNNSDDEDDIAERSFLPPPTHPQSPPIRISSGIETSKRIKYSTAEDTVSRSETVDPDKSRQQRMLSGTPLRTDMTPNRVTLTGQRVVSESYNGTPRSNGLIFTNTTTQPSTARRGSMNNARITSGMLTIPEPKIAEVEKELKEGPSSPASMLPPKADRIPMKKPYMEHPVVSGEESSSSSDTYDIPQNVEKSPSIRKQDSSHNETLEESPVKSSPFNTVSSQNNSERRRSSNLQSSFSKSSRDSQRLSSLEAKIENKSLSQRSIRRINNFSEDEIEDQQEELQVAKLPPRTKESKAPEVNETNDFPDNGDMDNVDQDTSMDIENEANNTVRYTDIKDELHNKSHEPVNKQDLLNILDKPQGIKSGKKLVDETENALLEKPTEQKESSAESVVETKLVATPPVQTKKRGAAETVKELMKTSEDVSTKKIKPSPTTNKKKESAGATQTKKQAETKRSPVKESSKNTSKSEEQNKKTVVPKKNVETSLSKEEEIKKTSIDPEKKGNVDLFEKFVSNTNVKRIKPAHEATQLKRTAQDESEYYSTSDDSDSDSEPVDSNRKERNIQINDIMSLQNTTSKKTTKPEAPKLSRKTATVTNTEKIASNNTSSSSEASSTNEENDSEAERKAILKPVTGTYPSPSIANRGTTETDALNNASTKAELETYRKARKVAKAKAVASNKTANKNQKVYQSPEFVSSSDDEDASTDTEKASSQTKVAPNPQDTAATKQGVKPEAIQKKEAASKLKIDSKEAINSKLAGKNKSEASAKVTNSSNEVSKTEAASQKINEDKKSAAATENAKAAKQTTDKAVKDTETKAVKKATKSPSKSVVEKPEPESTNIAGKKAETAETKSSSNISKSSVISKLSEADNKAQVKNVKPANKKAAKEETEPIKKDNVKEEKQPAKKAEPKPKPPVTTISKANNSKETDIKVAKPKQNVKEEAAKKDMKKELTKPTSKPSSEQNSSESSTDSSTSSGSDASSSSDSDNGSSSSGSDSDSGSSSSDESSSDEESSSARVSRRMIVAPPKGVLSETKPSNIKDTTHKIEDVSAIDEVPQSTQQPSKTPSKAVKQPSMTRPPLKSASKDTTLPSSQPTEPTISNMSSQPPQLDNSKSSANTSKVDNASPLSNLPRKYRPSLSSLSDLVSRGIPAVKDKHDKSSAPSLAKRGKEIKKDGSLSESESESSSSSSESESDSSGDSGSGDSSSDSDSDSSSDSDSDSDSSSSDEETYISAKSANAALNKKKKKTNGGGGFASLIKDSKKHK